jgi:hypothetical protein
MCGACGRPLTVKHALHNSTPGIRAVAANKIAPSAHETLRQLGLYETRSVHERLLNILRQQPQELIRRQAKGQDRTVGLLAYARRAKTTRQRAIHPALRKTRGVGGW